MTFLQSIESFLLELRDDYGFLLPVDRLEQCLVCATDITDVEEVFYRLQSMVCTSQEQMETFRSLFAQRLLQMQPGRPGSSKKQPKGDPVASARDKLKSLEQSLQHDRDELQRWKDEEEETSKQLTAAQRDLEEQIQKAEDIKNESAPLTPEDMRKKESDATPDLSNKQLSEHLKKTQAALQNVSKASALDKMKSPVKEDSFQKQVDAALRASNYKERLEEIAAKLLEAAGKARSDGYLKTFAALLEAVAAVKALSTAAGKSVPAAAKKALKEADKRRREHERYCDSLDDLLRKKRNNINILKSSLGNAVNARKRYEEKVSVAEQKAKEHREKTQSLLNMSQLIVKPSAMTHRSIFEGGVNSVQTTAEIAELMKVELQRMSPAEKQLVLTYIRTNARVFRQTLRRKYASHEKRQVDIRATARAAGRTGGEPIVVKYKKPKKSHAKVMILTDISGSCRRTATLALYFMAMMDEAFPGGCKKFAFVNSLEPADRFFRDKSPDDGIAALLTAIPTRGVYSDYGTTLHQFRAAYGGSIHKDTTVIILGDARNNSRASHADDLKYIADRCRKVFWLDPEVVREWDTGDSIVGEYVRAGADAFHVGTVGDLLKFLTDVS